MRIRPERHWGPRAADKPVRNRDGYARVVYAYDLHGHHRELAFFDENNQPTLRKGGYAKIVRTYDARGNMLEEALLDTEGTSIRGENGHAKLRNKHDERGYLIETTYYDERGRATNHKVGCAKIRNQYNHKGQWTERTCFGIDGSPVVGKEYGYAIATRIFDAGGKLLQIDFFDTDGNQRLNAEGYARVRYSYDEYGREIKREHFDVTGTPVLTRVVIDKVEPDSKSKRVGLQTGDFIIAYDGQEIADTRRFNELELMAGERPRKLTIEWEGKRFTLDVSPGRLKSIETVDKVPTSRKETGKSAMERAADSVFQHAEGIVWSSATT